MNNSFEPEIIVLYCGHGLATGEYLSEGAKKGSGFKVRFVMMPCSSKVEVDYLIRLIEQGVDGVQLVVCPIAKCEFMIGSARTEHRVEYARTLIAEVGMEAARLGVVEGHDLSADEFMAIAERRANEIGPLGPNPMKLAVG